jgi:hypothetical protein
MNETYTPPAEKAKNRIWLRTLAERLDTTHALTLNFTNADWRTSSQLFNNRMNIEEYEIASHKERTINASRWTFTSDDSARAKLQEKAEEILYNGFKCIAQSLYGPRYYKKNNMSRLVVYEYGKRENAHRLHAHCAIDLRDFTGSAGELADGVNRGIRKCGGLAANEYDLQEIYVKDGGYSWIDYITKHVDYSEFKNIDWRNSTIKKD